MTPSLLFLLTPDAYGVYVYLAKDQLNQYTTMPRPKLSTKVHFQARVLPEQSKAIKAYLLSGGRLGIDYLPDRPTVEIKALPEASAGDKYQIRALLDDVGRLEQENAGLKAKLETPPQPQNESLVINSLRTELAKCRARAILLEQTYLSG